MKKVFIATASDLSKVLDQMAKLQDEKARLSQTLEWVRDDLKKLLDVLGGGE